MADYKLGNFVFETEEELEQAKKELSLIKAVKDKYNVNDPRIAKAVLGKFKPKTIVGKRFVAQLNETIAKNEENDLLNAIDEDLKADSAHKTTQKEQNKTNNGSNDHNRHWEEDLQKTKDNISAKAKAAGEKAKKFAQDNDFEGKAEYAKEKTGTILLKLSRWWKKLPTFKKVIYLIAAIIVFCIFFGDCGRSKGVKYASNSVPIVKGAIYSGEDLKEFSRDPDNIGKTVKIQAIVSSVNGYDDSYSLYTKKDLETFHGIGQSKEIQLFQNDEILFTGEFVGLDDSNRPVFFTKDIELLKWRVYMPDNSPIYIDFGDQIKGVDVETNESVAFLETGYY